MRNIEPLKPEELQKLMSMGVVSIRPPETLSLSTLRNRAWRERNPENAAKYEASKKKYMENYRERKRKEKRTLQKA